MSSKRSMAPRRKSSMKKLFSKNRKFGGDGDVSAMSTQELSHNGKMEELQEKISSGASNVEGDLFALPPWNLMTNIQAALKGLVADRKKGTADPTNTARMDIIMYLIENGAKTDYLLNYLQQYPLPKEYLTSWIDRLVNTGEQDALVETLAEIQSAPESSTPGAVAKDYKAEMNAIFVTKKNTEPDAAKNMLFSVAKDGSPDNMTKMILNYKQDINAVDVESGKTPLIVAAENGNLGVVKVIFENENIRKNLLINKADKEGNTAFIVACNVQPVNEELVNYLAGKLDFDDLFLKNKAGKRGYDILVEHKKRIDNEKANENYNRTKTPAQMAIDSNQAISYVSLITTLKGKINERDNIEKAKMDASKKAEKRMEEMVLAEENEIKRKVTLTDALIKYINDNFKEQYLVFIDGTMRENDKSWKLLSKTCNTVISRTPYACKDLKFSHSLLQPKKTSLYTEMITHYKSTNEWLSFKDMVENIILKGIKDPDGTIKIKIMEKIKPDIDKSEAELSAANRSADIAKFAAFIPFKKAGSRRSKKRSASKTRKQKK
jgi:ankyrin repeat protein